VKHLARCVPIAAAFFAVGCAVPAGNGGKVTSSTSAAMSSESFYPGRFGRMETDWTPSPRQPASVPYASINIRADGTYGATTFPTARGDALAIEGQWKRVRTKVDGRLFYMLSLTEQTRWLFGSDPAPVAHTFEQEARFDADWSEYYRICFANGPSECVLYFESLSMAKAPELVELLVGPHSTKWTEGMGDSGPIPYRTIDFHDDGTYQAVIHDGASRHGAAGSIAGKWSFVRSTDGRLAVRMVENTPWIFSSHRASERHVFVVDVRAEDRDSYSLGFMNAHYEAPVFVADRVTQH
jgi:hypothetical protein